MQSAAAAAAGAARGAQAQSPAAVTAAAARRLQSLRAGGAGTRSPVAAASKQQSLKTCKVSITDPPSINVANDTQNMNVLIKKGIIVNDINDVVNAHRNGDAIIFKDACVMVDRGGIVKLLKSIDDITSCLTELTNEEFSKYKQNNCPTLRDRCKGKKP